MPVVGSFEKAKHYIESHEKGFDSRTKKGAPCITISRETGTGADRVGEVLINFFAQFNAPFTLFDKNLIDRVLEDNALPQKLSSYMPEAKFPAIKTAMNELFGLHPPMMSLLHKTTQTILQLAGMGDVIIVGRGANIITAKLENCFHIRLIAPVELRAKNMETYYGMTPKEAADFVKREDEARNKYVKINYNRDVNDLTQYHLVLNTRQLCNDEIAEIVGGTVVMKFPERFK
jgi:hypothetical protein